MLRPTDQEVTAMEKLVFTQFLALQGHTGKRRGWSGGLGKERETVGEHLHYGFLGKDQVDQG